MPNNNAQGEKKPKAKKGKKENKQNNIEDTNDHEISYDYDTEFDARANFERFQKYLEQKVESLKIEFDAKVETLHKIIDKKR